MFGTRWNSVWYLKGYQDLGLDVDGRGREAVDVKKHCSMLRDNFLNLCAYKPNRIWPNVGTWRQNISPGYNKEL